MFIYVFFMLVLHMHAPTYDRVFNWYMYSSGNSVRKLVTMPHQVAKEG